MKTNIFLLLFFLLSCQERTGSEDNKSSTPSTNCEPLYLEYDTHGVLRKWRQEWNNKYNRCDREIIPLSYYEDNMRKRSRNNITCTPQNIIPGITFLKSANNFYSYRNDRYLLSLDPSTGEYRRILYGENKSGEEVFSKEFGCFYIREDLENEPWGATDYGIQIYLEQPKSASSNVTMANEIYRITNMNVDWNFTAFDSTSDWSYQFCPYLSTPWEFCTLLRNGNIMFDSPLSNSQKSSLLSSALLIRTEYNFIEMDELEFEEKWQEVQTTIGESPQLDFKYKVKFTPDGPFYTESAWIDYIKDERPVMPDTNIIQQRPVCYNGFKSVVLEDGSSSFIRGEICYKDGVYDFTEF